MPTLKDIAARAGLSAMAVSKILNGRNLEKWPGARMRAERVRAIAKELDYRPDCAARAMKSKSLKQIGAILLNTGKYNLYYMAAYEYVAGMNAWLQKDGYTLSVIRLSDFMGDLDTQRFFQERMLDGVICVGLVADESFMGRLEANTGNCIWLDCNTWKDERCLRRDEVQAGYKAAKGLLDAGCRKIVWRPLSPGLMHFSSAERDAGARAAIREHGAAELVELPNGLGYNGVFSIPAFAKASSLRAARLGILATDYFAAQQTLAAGAKLGFAPGFDYALASCDEHSDACYVWPELSRVENWRYEYGERAAGMMMELLAGRPAPSVKIGGELRKGGTCALKHPRRGL